MTRGRRAGSWITKRHATAGVVANPQPVDELHMIVAPVVLGTGRELTAIEDGAFVAHYDVKHPK